MVEDALVLARALLPDGRLRSPFGRALPPAVFEAPINGACDATDAELRRRAGVVGGLPGGAPVRRRLAKEYPPTPHCDRIEAAGRTRCRHAGWAAAREQRDLVARKMTASFAEKDPARQRVHAGWAAARKQRAGRAGRAERPAEPERSPFASLGEACEATAERLTRAAATAAGLDKRGAAWPTPRRASGDSSP